jgi:hypothetical protein
VIESVLSEGDVHPNPEESTVRTANVMIKILFIEPHTVKQDIPLAINSPYLSRALWGLFPKRVMYLRQSRRLVKP